MLSKTEPRTIKVEEGIWRYSAKISWAFY